MKIKGKYRDVLSRDGEIIVDSGWKSNSIVPDYGRFLAALMKKDFQGEVGIDYIAVGGGSTDSDAFKKKVEAFFGNWSNPDEVPEPDGVPELTRDNWVWAKKTEESNITYLDAEGKEVKPGDPPTNRLRIQVEFSRKTDETEPEPSTETLSFREFALLGIDTVSDTFNTEKMFFINYVNHGEIQKDQGMTLTRTIELTFPINEEEE